MKAIIIWEAENSIISFLTTYKKKKISTKILEMLMMQKKIVVEQFKDENRDYFAKSQFPLSSTQSKIGFIWRMCESYELWCKEIGKTKLITLRVSD